MIRKKNLDQIFIRKSALSLFYPAPYSLENKNKDKRKKCKIPDVSLLCRQLLKSTRLLNFNERIFFIVAPNLSGDSKLIFYEFCRRCSLFVAEYVLIILHAGKKFELKYSFKQSTLFGRQGKKSQQ